MRLIGYIRVSSDEQARDGHSLGVQDAALQKYCDLYEHQLVDVVVDEGVSAGTPIARRKGGAELLERLAAKRAEGVVFTELDRLFRDTLDGLSTLRWFDSKGVQLHSVHEHIDTSDPDGRLLLTIKLGMAERERNKTSQRNRRVSAGLREQGRVYGHPPFGTTRVGDRLFRNERWGDRELIVQLRDGGKGLSLRAIASELQARGVPNTVGGKLWHVSTIKGILDLHHELEHIPALEDAQETPVSGGEQ